MPYRLAPLRFPDRRSKKDDASGDHPNPGRQHGKQENLGNLEESTTRAKRRTHDHAIHRADDASGQAKPAQPRGKQPRRQHWNEAAKTATPNGVTITISSQLAAASIPTMVD